MKNKKRKPDRTFIIVFFISVLLILFSGYISLRQYFPQKLIQTEEDDEHSGILLRAAENPGLFFDIEAYMKGNEAYIFLPETADASNIVFYTTDMEGNKLGRFRHDFTQGSMKVEDIEVRAVQSDLPSINLAIYDSYPTLEEVEDSGRHEVGTKAEFSMDDPDGKIVEGIVEMRGRGNTSWKEDKKSYQIKFEKNIDLMEMGDARTWVLLANAGDFSLLRNEVFLDLAADMGLEYTPELREVNLYINGEYRGAYSLAEKVENGKNRVKSGDGDYLYRIGMDADKNSFLAYENPYAEGEGNFKKLYGELRDAEDYEKIKRSQKYLMEAMNELYDSDSELSIMDLDSLARYYWLQEFSKTTDPTGRSVYLRWSAAEQKMFMGPAWDYDRTAGIIEMPFLEEDYIWPDGWTARVRDYYVPLFENENFLRAVREVYENGGVKEAFRRAADSIPERVEKMSRAAQMNFIRWDVLDEPESNKVSEVYNDNSWESQVTWLQDWLSLRCDFIEDEMKKDVKTAE